MRRWDGFAMGQEVATSRIVTTSAVEGDQLKEQTKSILYQWYSYPTRSLQVLKSSAEVLVNQCKSDNSIQPTSLTQSMAVLDAAFQVADGVVC